MQICCESLINGETTNDRQHINKLENETISNKEFSLE